jgi:DNA-binding transcriptional ArsR family regulator
LTLTLEIAYTGSRGGHAEGNRSAAPAPDPVAAHFDVTRPAVSQHLNVLKEAGLVSERRNGTRRLYRARPEGLNEVKAFLEEFWDERLDVLKREAEREERKKRGKDS